MIKVDSEGLRVSDNETWDKLTGLIAEVCAVDPGTIVPNARLRGYGLDSLRVLNLMMTIEEEIQVEFRLEDLAEIYTVGELADYIDKLRTIS